MLDSVTVEPIFAWVDAVFFPNIEPIKVTEIVPVDAKLLFCTAHSAKLENVRLSDVEPKIFPAVIIKARLRLKPAEKLTLTQVSEVHIVSSETV